MQSNIADNVAMHKFFLEALRLNWPSAAASHRHRLAPCDEDECILEKAYGTTNAAGKRAAGAIWLRLFACICAISIQNVSANVYTFDSNGRLTLVVASDATSSHFEYDTAGNITRKAIVRPGTRPATTVAPNPLNFGSVTIGAPTTQAITVTNLGPGNLTVSQVNVSGTAFSIASNACTTITPTNNCAITVQFAPTVTGAATGTVTITSNATASPQSVTLNGTGTAATDVTPPTTPTTLTATSPTVSTIALNWSASTDSGGSGLAGYKVERCAGSGCSNFAQIATPTANSFGDTGLTASTIYSYRVRAHDNAGNLSGYSNVATVATLGTAVNGTCGTANLGTFAVAPSGVALCSAGTPSTLTGTGPWSWTCQGLNGGSNASCSASYAPPGVCSGGTNEICDLFSAVGVNTALWAVIGNSVTQTGNGEIALTADVTDNTGRIRTLTLPESSIVTVRAKHYLVPGNAYFYPMITLLDATGNLVNALQWRKSAYEASEVCNGVSTFDHPVLQVPNVTCAGAAAATSSSLYGRWSETTLTYNATTGLITVDLDSDGSIDISTTVPVAQRKTVSAVGFHGYGWYTGHLMKLDHVRINYVPTAAAIPYTLVVNAGTGGTTLPSGSSQRLVGESVTVVAQPNSGYAFSGWTGYASCGAAATCTFTMPAAAVTLAAGFAPVQQPTSCVLDLDGDGSVSALTDGLMLMRILRGATGSAITAGVMGTGTLARPTSAAIAAFVQAMRDSMALDVDGNGVVELADALIIQRAMLGMNGESVLNGTGQTGSPARSTWLAVRDYLVQSCGMSSLSTAAGTGATGRLNDTGITWGGNSASGNNATCTGAAIAQQDCSTGRDGNALTNNDADGKAGFSFTKISNSGNALASNALLGTGPNDWACTYDNVTGLMWEVKTSSGLRSMNHTYSWYSSDSATNGGSFGTASGGTCASSGRCDTEKFVQDVNIAGLCGRNDWRMPNIGEIEGIVSFGGSAPLIDQTYFPNTPAASFWSSSPYADNFGAWSVLFDIGFVDFDGRNNPGRVFVVRGGR